MVRNGKKIIGWCIFFWIQCWKMFFRIPNGNCRFTPTCSEYAREAIETLPLLKATSAIVIRVLKCHPMNCGGFDPVHDNKVTTKG